MNFKIWSSSLNEITADVSAPASQALMGKLAKEIQSEVFRDTHVSQVTRGPRYQQAEIFMCEYDTVLIGSRIMKKGVLCRAAESNRCRICGEQFCLRTVE